ncbi:hypothetical protein OUZ56_018833 [Daphnia magna]|uniref:Uncharacterized protein n=1 Tax=Daphnia magna TaxID=35525 RepID=A0ABQ9Z9X5_9CRUS|nr:hypothetical protein OUZ56_018833 [Daphnia magna]
MEYQDLAQIFLGMATGVRLPCYYTMLLLDLLSIRSLIVQVSCLGKEFVYSNSIYFEYLI